MTFDRNTLVMKPALKQTISRIGTLTYDNSFCPSALRKTTESVIFHTRRKGKRDECAFRNSISFLTLYDFAGSICLHALSYKHIPYLNSNTIRTTFNPPVGFKHEMPYQHSFLLSLENIVLEMKQNYITCMHRRPHQHTFYRSENPYFCTKVAYMLFTTRTKSVVESLVQVALSGRRCK